ncbi:MAG: hypothetical protein FWG10_12815 [Eubacteriaceae bacterium]|nr:hypothetical protein [Eubacteriaceae bacterium]
MAIYHYHKDFVKRSEGHSATAKAAYQAAERIYDERTGAATFSAASSCLWYSPIILSTSSSERATSKFNSSFVCVS